MYNRNQFREETDKHVVLYLFSSGRYLRHSDEGEEYDTSHQVQEEKRPQEREIRRHCTPKVSFKDSIKQVLD